jgi:hypothetical protein
MALLFANHTLTFRPVTEPTSAEGDVQTPIEGADVEVTGQLSPLTSQAAFERFGVDLSRPHRWRYEIEDESSVKVGYVATYGSRKFEVKAPPMKHQADGLVESLNCMECVLEEREFN